jgi:hypothetical protein
VDGVSPICLGRFDPEPDETLNILKDLVDLNRGPTTASITSTPAAN